MERAHDALFHRLKWRGLCGHRLIQRYIHEPRSRRCIHERHTHRCIDQRAGHVLVLISFGRQGSAEGQTEKQRLEINVLMCVFSERGYTVPT